MTIRTVGDEIEPGVSAAVDRDPARIDAFAEPELGQRLAETVGADGGEIGGVGAEPRRRDHRVRSVAAEPLHEGRPVVGLVEFDQRLPDSQEIRHILPRGDSDRDPSHKPAGGAMHEPHRPGRGQKHARAVRGQRVTGKG